MIRAFYIIAVMLISEFVCAEDWRLEESSDGHWISNRHSEQHQFIVAGQGESVQFLIILMLTEKSAIVPKQVTTTIDNKPRLTHGLKLLERQPSGLLLRLEFGGEDKELFIEQMVTGLNLSLNFSQEGTEGANLVFSLLGFTSVYNELLIANDVGRLNESWMRRKNKNKELVCYKAATLSVEVLKKRIEGQKSEKTLKTIPRSGLAAADDMLPDLVKWAYQIPSADLPVKPSAEKYGVFKRCMGSVAVEPSPTSQ